MTELDRMILLMRRAAGMSKEIAKLINNLFKKLTRAINLNKPITENIAEINKIFKDIDLSDEVAEKLLAVSGATVKIYSDLTPIKPTKALINRSLNKVMPDSNQTIKQGIERTENLTKTSVINYTHQAHDNGWTNKELGAALKTTEAQTVRHVQTIANTAVSAAANQTKTELFKANGIDQVIYTATLDGRTSDFCMSMDGKVFDIDDAPSIPAHYNCRSTTVPLMEGENANDVMNELLPRPNVTAKDYNKEDGDYSLKGGMSQSKNYETWLKKQPAYYQKDIIGVKASKEFRDGKPLKDVIKTSPITEDYLNKALN